MSNLEDCKQNTSTPGASKCSVMNKQVQKKADGRTIIFYSFDSEGAFADVTDKASSSTVKGKSKLES